jgi:molybdenum cofactor synthesis domain-containing protein
MGSLHGPYRAVTVFREISEVLAEASAKVKPLDRVISMRTRDAVGLILARDVVAPSDHPPLDMSHMDGFAVRSADTIGASEKEPVFLKVVGSIGPGGRHGKIDEGLAVRIHTGGYLPQGADTVIRQEDVDLVVGDKIVVTRKYEPLENVVQAGSEVREGEILARRGEVLGPVMASLLETLGVTSVEVESPVRVAIISIGDELTDDPAKVREGKILNTHGHLIYHMLGRLFCEPLKPVIVPDDPDRIRAALMDAVRESDCVLTIGGSSVGDIDFLAAELKRVAELFIQGVKLQPGRVGGVAVISGKPLVMLPGLIHSTLNVFNYLAVPILATLTGTKIEQFFLKVKALLDSEINFPKRRNFKRIVWVSLSLRKGGYLARPNIADASNIRSIAISHGYVELPPDVERIGAGELVDVRIPLYLLDTGLNIFDTVL